MERTDLEGFIYDCKKDVHTVYCPLLGEVFMDGNTKMTSKSTRPAVGKWCRFSAQRMGDDHWYARRVELMTYPRLKYVRKGEQCIIEGTAVVCNIEDKCGYLWNDYIGFIAVEGEVVHKLKPLTAVEFQAVPFKKKDSPAYFMVTEVTMEEGSVFQSDLLLFARNAEIVKDGKAYVPSCFITLSEKACSFLPTIGTKISVLYYRHYDDNSSGVGIYATTDNSVVAGIAEDFFTTERYGVANFECNEEDELFCDAHEDIGVMLSHSPVTEKEAQNVAAVMLEMPSESIVEFAESDGSHRASSEATPVANGESDLWEQFESSASFNSPYSSNGSVPGDASASISLNKKNTVVDSESQIRCISQEDLWDEEFVEHLKTKMKEIKKFQGEEVKCNGSKLEIEAQCDIKTGREKLCDEMISIRVLLEERLASMRRVQSSGTVEGEGDDSFDKGLQPAMLIANEMDFKVIEPGENNCVRKEPSTITWTEDMDLLCAEVLSNPSLRNFVSVNRDGLAVLRDITKYLECQMTAEEISERIGIPLSELTPACFDMVHEEQAVEICTEIKEMDGFERIANRKIPRIAD